MPTIPSFLTRQTRGTDPHQNALLVDYVLRKGEVRKIVPPTDPTSQSKQWVEYTVAIDHRTGAGGTSTLTVGGVIAMSMLGGTADYLRYTYRPGVAHNSGIGEGSKVLVLFVSGDMRKGVIIGGIPDPKFAGTTEPYNGHELRFEFNGVRTTINADGELNVTFRGATNADGSLAQSANAQAEGTSLTIDKDGTLTVGTPSNAQFVKLDHKNKKLEMLVDQEWHATVNGKTQFDIQNDFVLNSSAGGCSIGLANSMAIKSSGVLVGNANESWVLGTTYRRQESTLNNTLSTNLTTAAGQAGAIAAALTAAGPLLAIPIYGGAMAAPFIGTAAGMMTSLASTLGSMAAAYGQFEGTASTYLSTRNFGD